MRDGLLFFLFPRVETKPFRDHQTFRFQVAQQGVFQLLIGFVFRFSRRHQVFEQRIRFCSNGRKKKFPSVWQFVLLWARPPAGHRLQQKTALASPHNLQSLSLVRIARWIRNEPSSSPLLYLYQRNTTRTNGGPNDNNAQAQS